MEPDSKKKRQKTVTEEPFVLGEAVKGRALASLRRRLAALSVDTVLFVVLATPLLIAISIAAMRNEAPALARTMIALATFEPVEDANRGVAELLLLVARRRPGAVPGRFADALEAGDLAAVEASLDGDAINVSVDLNSTEPSYYDSVEDRLYLNKDVIFGRWASAFGYAAMALMYFTVAARLGRGRTPGKWLFGVRTVRLDGEPLRLWDTFSRAGGYAASLSTAGLGFVEAWWDPNLQALHDRVAATVVVRDPRRSLVPWRLPKDREIV